ncbi:MAG: protein translocase subunit SecD [Gammaproteobacteria bacterium]|nr:MAG: protein translocase subunit SecD [Gammaproteobacteria bacterium]
MNRYPLWKYLLIVGVLTLGMLYALPNLYGEDPAVQVSGSRTAKIDINTLAQVERTLKTASIRYRHAVMEDKVLSVRFDSTEDQLKARDLVQRDLGVGYTVALNLLPATPAWLQAMDIRPMYLGLDLRGGVHFLMQVDMAAVIEKAEESYADDLRRIMRKEKIRYRGVSRLVSGGLEARFRDEATRDSARSLIRSELPELVVEEKQRDGQYILAARISQETLTEKRHFALEQNMTSLRNRVNELGVAEPIVQQQGDERIVVQLPGVQDTAKAKEILGRTATLEFRLVDEQHDPMAALSGRVPAGSKLYKDRRGTPILLKKRIIYSGDNIVDSAPGFDSQSNTPIVSITLDARGATVNQRVTGKNVGKRMAAVYIEIRAEPKLDKNGNPVLDEEGKAITIKRRVEEVITAPVIKSQLGKRFQIEGLDSVEEANDLSLLLRAGALAAPIEIIEERTIGPSLGQDNIDQGRLSIVIGFVAILIFVIMYYRKFGVIANVALAFNIVLMVAVLSLFQATLTLPGIAGILLTVGMAVDANVLIFERIREEVRNGNSPQASIHAGYEKAFSTITDANITTLIAAIMLFNFGTGPIKGFAITLSIGILTSMFTAIVVARGLTNLWFGGKRLTKLSI